MVGNSKTITIASPGRINLIGEHVDYNDGLVLPAAIDQSIYITLNASESGNSFKITSEGFDETFSGDLKDLETADKDWHRYIVGVLSEIQKRSDGLRGFNCNLRSDIPTGSGLSSSAALECGLAFGLNELFNLGLSRWDLIHIGQDAEHHYVGTQCGIMDQFASVMGKSGHCMLLDCKNLEFEYVPAEFSAYKLLLLNSNVTHSLANSGYNIRREESATALGLLSDFHNTNRSYRSLNEAQIEEARTVLSANQYKRARFVVEEISRVKKAVTALRNNKLEDFGDLLFQSHEGLSKDYEVSCPENDFLVNLARGESGILGARQVGGGFGGCTLNLIHETAATGFIAMAQRAYNEEFDRNLSWIEATPAAGTRML